jgi:hypothetical protein
VEHDDDLVRLPLLTLICPPIPDRDLPGTVVAGRDRALEVDVAQRMVLDVHGLAIVLWVLGDAIGDRPRDERAVVLQPQVPMKTAGMMLVNHEPRADPRPPVGRGLGRPVEAPLVPVLAKQARRLPSGAHNTRPHTRIPKGAKHRRGSASVQSLPSSQLLALTSLIAVQPAS